MLKDSNNYVTLPQDQSLYSHGLPYLPLLSRFISQSLILPVTIFLSANIFVVVHSQGVPMLYLVYCKSKRKFYRVCVANNHGWWRMVKWKGKSQGIEGSANANDVWIWMRPHIGLCTIEKCDLLSFFLLIESLPAAYKFHHLFFETWSFFMRCHCFCLSILAPSFFLFEDPSFCWEEIPLIRIF
jgi:hypothetical protein